MRADSIAGAALGRVEYVQFIQGINHVHLQGIWRVGGCGGRERRDVRRVR